MKRLFLGSDHAGFTLKESLKAHITKTYLSSTSPLFEIEDVGTNSLSSCHYPDYPEIISKKIQPEDRAIVVCGSGIGIGISMAKCGVSCATVWNEYLAGECAKLCQAMAMGERAIGKETANQMAEVFLEKWIKGIERDKGEKIESGEKGEKNKVKEEGHGKEKKKIIE